eukprot:m51a1_g4335 hypothetical protein (598) ;mRNA; f:151525-153318
MQSAPSEPSATGRVDTVVVVEVDPSTAAAAARDMGSGNAPATMRAIEQAPSTTDPKQKAKKEPLGLRLSVLTVLLIIMSLSVMFIEMCLVPALPQMREEWPDKSEWIPWVLSSYTIVGAIWTSISGSLTDIFGPKWIMIGSLVLYSIGQLMAALCTKSRGIFLLLAARAVQGLGTGASELSVTIVNKLYPRAYREPIIAMCMSTLTVGMSLGLVGGAAALEKIEWNELFWVTFPIVLVLVVAFYFVMPGPTLSDIIFRRKANAVTNANANANDIELATPGAEKKPAEEKKSLRDVDWLGAVLLTIGCVAFLMSLTFSESHGWKSGVTLGLLLGGSAFIVATVLWELYTPKPLIPVRMLLDRAQASVAVITFLSGVAGFSMFQMLPSLYVSPFMNYKVTRQIYTGLYMLPFGCMGIPDAIIGTKAGRWIGYPIVIVVSTALCVVTSGLYIQYHDTVVQTACLNGTIGVGFGIAVICLINYLSVITPREKFGSISGMNMLLRFIGGSMGPVFVDLIMNRDTMKVPVYGEMFLPDAFHNGFIFLTACWGACWLSTFLMPRKFAIFTKEGREYLAKMRSKVDNQAQQESEETSNPTPQSSA